MDESFATPDLATAAVADARRDSPNASATLGEVRFLGAASRAKARRELHAIGMLVVELEVIDPSARGLLADVIDDAIERELGARGSSGPSIASASDRDSALSDQLYRARRAGAAGIAIVIGSLAPAGGTLGALSPEDCATLRFFVRAARERTVSLVLDERDSMIGGYGDPIPLCDVLSADAVPPRSRLRPVAADASSVPTPVAEDAATQLSPLSPLDSVAAELGRADTASPLRHHLAGASFVDQEEAWRNWTLQLAAARGPQPLAALERLFADSYMPLANALAAGLDDPRARAAHDEFRNTFIRSYTDAFPTFAATTKRPRMVLDVHDVAARIARLHGARSTRLLLVDAMRWDVSRLVAQRVAAKLGERAALTDELLLWSALPTTTMRQLETIARGVEALRAPSELDADGETTRGRTAEYVRRLRVGPREIHKLDLVEARIQGARGAVLRTLPEIAEATADVIARHAETLSPHTLLFVFGDHGFAIDRSGAARQGSASPEEVIVGAFALLVGDVH